MAACKPKITETMLRLYGPVIGGADLRKALGFRSASAFNRALRLKSINVNVFTMPGRRGRFAFTADVGKWLESVGEKHGGSEATTSDRR